MLGSLEQFSVLVLAHLLLAPLSDVAHSFTSLMNDNRYLLSLLNAISHYFFLPRLSPSRLGPLILRGLIQKCLNLNPRTCDLRSVIG